MGASERCSADHRPNKNIINKIDEISDMGLQNYKSYSPRIIIKKCGKRLLRNLG
jgi:hypothetical protein